jgi:mono/diheme cytochrome c family protein
MTKFYGLTIILLLLLIISLTACGGSTNASPAQAAPAGDPAAGKELFVSTCVVCHGPDAKGLPGLGKNLVASEFVADKSDRELVEFIKVGRGPDDPLNTTGVTMPPKGGKTSLTEEDLYNIVAYIRTLQP